MSSRLFKIEAVMKTWGQRCDKLLLAVDEGFPSYFTEIIIVPEANQSTLAKKVTYSFEYVYDKFSQQFDWFLKADDDTYVFVDNLKKYLKDKSLETPAYYGALLNKDGFEFMSGGAGYFINKKTLSTYVQLGIRQHYCTEKSPLEDYNFGICMNTLKITFVDTWENTTGKGRSFPFSPSFMFDVEKYHESKHYLHMQVHQSECCSESMISFHYVSPTQMLMLDYFVHNITKKL